MNRYVGIALALVLVGAPARADEYPVQVSVAGGAEWLEFSRYAPNRPTAGAAGTLTALAVEAQLAAPSSIFARARFGTAFGPMDYNGYDAELRPATTRTDSLTLTGELALGGRLDLSPEVFLTEYVGIGRRFWKLETDRGSRVDRSWWYAAFGTMLEARTSRRTQLLLDLAAVPSFAAQTHTYDSRESYPGWPALRDTTFEPGGKLGFRARVGTGYFITERAIASVIGTYEYTAFGQSPDVALRTREGGLVPYPPDPSRHMVASDPASKQHRLTGLVQLSYVF